MIIGVGGQLQNGKDTIADYLQQSFNRRGGNWKRISFAAKVKAIYCDTFGVDLAFIEKWKVINEPPPGFLMTVRKSLQFIGDGFRQIQGSVWIDNAYKNIKEPSICSDVRYVNELSVTKLKYKGLTIVVWRPGSENDDQNGSEAQMRPIVDFYAKTGLEGVIPFEGLDQSGWFVDKGFGEPPPGAELVDIFIRNDEDVESLYTKVEQIIVPEARVRFPQLFTHETWH
jgi:hypothetical protein